MSTRIVAVDFIADIVCPWCYVGWKSFRQTQGLRPHLTFAVRWRPYLLNADIPPKGVDRRAYYAEHAAADPDRFAAARAALVSAAAEANAPLNLDAATLMPNAINAHRLIWWANGQDRGGQAVDALFAAYFVDGRDIGDADTLASIGGRIGLDAERLRTLFATDADRDTIALAHDAAVQMGVSAVPVLIFDRKTASLGADKPEAYASAIDQALTS